MKPVRLATLWTAALLPPLAWAIDLDLSVMLSRHAVASGQRTLLGVVSGVSFLLALLGVGLAWSGSRRLSADDPKQTVAVWGRNLGVFFVVLIVAMSVPLFVFLPGEVP